ncbi:hypothetical protein SUGI_1169610 [Cryptomeria japonica]|uniref:cytochrome P450 86B1-like n=1 Tax=Cryptomeria japonica TaxID=3369 RepID=UPI002414AFA3|nr:cytochrome P450 86B1-like [Cryptomeria japonica]GLJ54459.1 hypothetical protein SUGI_1169610 [Cryptomeria japonica]
MAIIAEVIGNGITVFTLWFVGTTSIIVFCIYSLKPRVRPSFRGAPVWPLVGVLPSLLFHFGHLYDWFTHLVIINGGTFRLPGPWKFRVFTADPANIEYLLKTRYHNFGKGEIFKETFRDMFGESIVVQDGEPFKRLNISIGKALASPAFRDSAAAALPAVMQQKLVPVFTHACENSTIIDLQDVFHRLAFYNVCRFGAGVELGCLSPGLPKVPFLEAFEEALQSLMLRLLMPPFCWKILRFFNVLFERRLLKARETIYGFVLHQVHSRWRANGQDVTQGSDIGSAFIRFERESGRFYSDKGVHELFVSLILAGKDTITPGLTWFFWLVANNPRVEAQILAELREIVKQRKSLHDQDPFSFSFEEVKSMAYLHATVTESLRLYPPIPLELTASLEDDVLPDGTPMKKGEQILYSIYSSGRLGSVWGEDYLEFKPERWMKNGRFVRESDFKFLAFNAGARRCTGREFGYWQMKWAAASILVRYQVKIVDEHPVVPKYGLSLYMKYGLLATIHQREKDEVIENEKGKG